MKCQLIFSGENKKISFCHRLNLSREWLRLTVRVSEHPFNLLKPAKFL